MLTPTSLTRALGEWGIALLSLEGEGFCGRRHHGGRRETKLLVEALVISGGSEVLQ
jgi:hypothetical protein